MKNIMKISFTSVGNRISAIFLFLCLVLFSITLKSQNVGISTTGLTPDASAMLDIVSTSKGLLIPRMTYAQMTGIGTPATGLLAYATDGIGFYFYNGAAWVPILSGSSNNGGWTLTGNSGTTASTANIGTAITANSNFIGTTDVKDLVFATNNGTNTYERMRVTSSGGYIGISNKTPTALLDIGTPGTVGGVLRLEGSTSGYINIQTVANVATSWTLTLPYDTASSTGQALTTDGTGITSWTSVSGGAIDSVNGTVPIYVATPATTPVVSIQGLNANQGGVLYSTGPGNSAAFNATGTAPSGNVTQILVSQGAAAPTWNTVGGIIVPYFKGEVNASSTTIDESSYNNFGASGTYYLSNLYGEHYGASNAETEYTMPKCLLTRVHIVPNSNGLSGTSTFTIYKNGTGQSMTGTLAAGSSTAFDITTNPVTFADGDYMDIKLVTGAGVVLTMVKIDLTYYLLP